MMASYCISSYNKKDSLSESKSDVHIFVNEYRNRINMQLKREEENARTEFISFAEKKISLPNISWLEDNAERFIRDTPNEELVNLYYPTEYGCIYCMAYSPNGEQIILGFSSGMIQASKMSQEKIILAEEAQNLKNYYLNEKQPKVWYPMFYRAALKQQTSFSWVDANQEMFLKGTHNDFMYHRWYFSESGAITSMQYSPGGHYVIVGHSSGLIVMRNGITGAVLCTLRNIHFPPKPVYALQYSPFEENVCYAACMDGIVYRVEIPHMDATVVELPSSVIRADPMLETLNTQFYGSPGISAYSSPFITSRYPALSMALLAEQNKMVVGYADTSVKIYDMETQEAVHTYKVHKSRLQFIPKKLQRMHCGQVVAMKEHPQKPNTFVTGAWDKTLRVWDVRCKIGCVMTFEGVDIYHDSIDMIRDHCITGSWQTTEALAVWDFTAKKKINIIRVQNRRPDVDGEYIYACRYWRSSDYNRKGKYGIIGGSGTKCVEVINLHNRYISCSYPAPGTVLAIASYQERIAFGGTHPAFCIVSFHDPKHEKALYEPEITPDYDFTKPSMTVFANIDLDTTTGTPLSSDYESDTKTSKKVAMSEPETK